jgi:hypothetical protein
MTAGSDSTEWQSRMRDNTGRSSLSNSWYREQRDFLWSRERRAPFSLDEIVTIESSPLWKVSVDV